MSSKGTSGPVIPERRHPNKKKWIEAKDHLIHIEKADKLDPLINIAMGTRLLGHKYSQIPKGWDKNAKKFRSELKDFMDAAVAEPVRINRRDGQWRAVARFFRASRGQRFTFDFARRIGHRRRGAGALILVVCPIFFDSGDGCSKMFP